MTIKYFMLVLLVAGFSCTTNRSLSDAEKNKIKAEVKEVVDTIFKGSEAADFEMITEPWLNSPDFLILINGRTFTYEQAMAMKPAFNAIVNQKGTVISEKYAVIDNSTVLYTANCTWLVNYKDGRSVREDPEVFLFVFRKIENRWRVVYYADSYYEKSVTNENSNGLSQVELHKKFIGNWKAAYTGDTMIFWDVRAYGNGMEGSYRHVVRGKTVLEGKQLWGPVEDIGKFILTEIPAGVNKNGLYTTLFVSEKKCEIQKGSDASTPVAGSKKWEMEFRSPDKLELTCLQNNHVIGTYTMIRTKSAR